MTSTTLIRGGVVIDTDPRPSVLGRVDVLIEDGRIAAVGAGLPDGPGTTVIDATDRIVLPGFVDTHRHTWQAGIRGIAPYTNLGDYVDLVLYEIAPRYRPEDMYTGNLAGALECLDAGITTVVDWSHIQPTPEHTDATIEGLKRSGIRAVFGYCYTGDGGSQARAAEARRIHGEHFGASGTLLSMLIAAWGPEIVPPEQAADEWRLARELGLPVSVHMGGKSAESAESGLAALQEYDLLGTPTSYVHPNHFSDDALKRIADTGGSASLSPIIEAGMAMGYPSTGRARAAGVPSSLGADAVTSGPGDMFSLMRAAYTLERARPDGAGLGFTPGDALRMATAEGAEVAGLGEVTGSLRPGRQADLVLLRTDTPAMAPALDPITAVVLSADTSAVDTVLVAGRVVKKDGRLLHHDLKSVLGALADSVGHVTTPA